MKSILLLTAIILVLGCRKHHNSPDNQKKLIGTWKLLSSTSDQPFDWDGNGVKETNLLSLSAPCNNYQTIIFKTDSTATVFRGCDPDSNARWRLSDEIYIIIASLREPLTIIELTDSSLKLTHHFPLPNGEDLLITDGYLRQ